jgi:1-acyl-sn-glycerol-3-phosphate acyltransferase
VKAFHLEKLPIEENPPIIFMSNHLSLFDLPLIMSTIPKSIRVVIKKELVSVPFLGKAALASEQVVIDRKDPSNRQAFYKNAAEKLNSGIALWVFPEGTRSKSGHLLPFKMGCFRLAQIMGAKIIPVGIIGTNRILPAGKLLPKHRQAIEIHIGDAIDANLYPSEEDLLRLSQLTEHSIKALIQNENHLTQQSNATH